MCFPKVLESELNKLKKRMYSQYVDALGNELEVTEVIVDGGKAHHL